MIFMPPSANTNVFMFKLSPSALTHREVVKVDIFAEGGLNRQQ
jgi:hypothetical protein